MSGRAKYQELLCTALAAQLAAQVPSYMQSLGCRVEN